MALGSSSLQAVSVDLINMFQSAPYTANTLTISFPFESFWSHNYWGRYWHPKSNDGTIVACARKGLNPGLWYTPWTNWRWPGIVWGGRAWFFYLTSRLMPWTTWGWWAPPCWHFSVHRGGIQRASRLSMLPWDSTMPIGRYVINHDSCFLLRSMAVDVSMISMNKYESKIPSMKTTHYYCSKNRMEWDAFTRGGVEHHISFLPLSIPFLMASHHALSLCPKYDKYPPPPLRFGYTITKSWKRWHQWPRRPMPRRSSWAMHTPHPWSR